jgi:hypothetical protein
MRYVSLLVLTGLPALVRAVSCPSMVADATMPPVAAGADGMPMNAEANAISRSAVQATVLRFTAGSNGQLRYQAMAEGAADTADEMRDLSRRELRHPIVLAWHHCPLLRPGWPFGRQSL